MKQREVDIGGSKVISITAYKNTSHEVCSNAKGVTRFLIKLDKAEAPDKRFVCNIATTRFI